MAARSDASSYRFEMFRLLGFDVADAARLAATRTADWHDVKRALDSGCTHAQAVRIYI